MFSPGDIVAFINEEYPDFLGEYSVLSRHTSSSTTWVKNLKTQCVECFFNKNLSLANPVQELSIPSLAQILENK